jgi:hypothetical protein
LEGKVAAPIYKTENMAIVIHCNDHATPSICKKLALTLAAGGGGSVSIVRSQTKATKLLLLLLFTHLGAVLCIMRVRLMLCQYVWVSI